MRPSATTPRHPRFVIRHLSFVIPALLLAACSSGSSPSAGTPQPALNRDPAELLSILASTSTPDDSRQHADKLLVEQKTKTDPARLDVLEQLLYAPGHSDAMRIYALDQLANANPAAAGHALELYLPRFKGPVLDHACRLAVTLGDARLVAPLTRSLARIAHPHSQPPMQTLDNYTSRPEWPAIEKLAGKEPGDAFFDLLGGDNDQSVRIAALDILQAITSRDAIAARLATIDRHDPWLDDLRWYINLFNTPPVGPTENSWMQYLHRPEFTALVNRAADRHRQLAQKPDYLFAPRFIAVLAYTDNASLSMTKLQLLNDLSVRLAPLKHINRPPQYEHAPDDIDESLAANRDKLTLCDLFAIRLLLDGLADSSTINEFHREGLDDLSDTTTEHGGLLSLQNINQPQLVITLYPPYFAANDFQYVASDKLLQETAAGIAQYHFHFQQIHNEERAGPGTGDLDYVRDQHCNAVVITSIDTRKINIDYYTPDAAVVDLGVYTAQTP